MTVHGSHPDPMTRDSAPGPRWQTPTSSLQRLQFPLGCLDKSLANTSCSNATQFHPRHPLDWANRSFMFQRSAIVSP